MQPLPSGRSGRPGDMCMAPPGDGAPAEPGGVPDTHPAGQTHTEPAGCHHSRPLASDRPGSARQAGPPPASSPAPGDPGRAEPVPPACHEELRQAGRRHHYRPDDAAKRRAGSITRDRVTTSAGGTPRVKGSANIGIPAQEAIMIPPSTTPTIGEARAHEGGHGYGLV